MSRSNPGDNTPNPSTRWFEWNGETGVVFYYDKEQNKKIDVGSSFQFILLDELATIRGWHKSSKSGIYSNEVRDTRSDVFIVKAFKGGTLAEGLYKDIKDRVNSQGGYYTSNCYIAYKNGKSDLAVGSIRFKGSALGAWMEFRKAHRADLLTKAIRIAGFTEGKTGKITFRMPVLTVTALSSESNSAAVALDQELQTFLSGYLKRTKREQVEATASASPPDVHDEDTAAFDNEPPPHADDDIPF